MSSLKQLLQTADWKTEKHVPVIEAAASVSKAEPVKVTVTVGKEIAHPNTTEHHIAWVELYFHPAGEKFPYQLGRFDLSAHGAGQQGPNTSTVSIQPSVGVSFKTEKSGTIIAVSYCNIHGLWENTQELAVV